MPEENYKELIINIKKDITKTQYKIMRNANTELVNLYFRLGKIISENVKYGNHFITILSKSLKLDFSNLNGFSERNLWRMKAFYEEYKEFSIVPQPVAQLPWSHNILLIEKIKDKKIREIYIKAILENGWSRNILLVQIETQYHLRIGASSNNFNSTLPKIDSDLVNNTIKDPYIFDFITLKETFKEKELETKLIEKIKDVLIELGNGFSFVGNQYKITIDNFDYYIDLLFYHLKLRCYIIVELKATKFIPEYVGKMNFYISAIDEQIKSNYDNPTIGLILCKEKDKLTAKYSLKNLSNPIGISSYEISKFLPKEKELNNHLNNL